MWCGLLALASAVSHTDRRLIEGFQGVAGPVALGKELLSGFAPHETLWIRTVLVLERLYRSLQSVHAFEGSASQLLAGQLSNPAIDQVQLRVAGRDEVHAPTTAWRRPETLAWFAE